MSLYIVMTIQFRSILWYLLLPIHFGLQLEPIMAKLCFLGEAWDHGPAQLSFRGH